MDDTLYNVKEMVTKELDELTRTGKLNENTLHCMDKLVDILKDVGEIEEKEEGYSMAPYSREGRSNRGYSNDGYSYRQSREGRYSNNSYRGRYSREGGYSREGEREDIIAKMEMMKNNAGSEIERQTIQRILNQL